MFARCPRVGADAIFFAAQSFFAAFVNVPAPAQQRDYCWPRPRRLFDDRLGFTLDRPLGSVN